ncbi:MAG: DNRLRE domain-containing protein [Kiritimatiellae bacterium]|nr:DNRLRE domain-containing protein [Kiritimatiellia bacterium]
MTKAVTTATLGVLLSVSFSSSSGAPPIRQAHLEFQNGVFPCPSYEGNFALSLNNDTWTYHKLTAGNGTDHGRRPVLSFEVASLIPPDAQVLDARLTLYCDYDSSKRETPPFAPPLSVDVHKLTAGWGKPDIHTVGPVRTSASIGQACWSWSHYSQKRWAAPGGDFDATVVDTRVVSDISTTYTWDVTSIVQDWVADPENNFGLLLKASVETKVEHWKRFKAARYEYEGRVLEKRPRLAVDWAPSFLVPQRWPYNSTREDAFDLDNYFLDPDGDPLSFSASTNGGSNVEVVIDADNTVSFVPAPGWFGTEVVTFAAADPGGGSTNSNPVVLTVYKVVELPPQRWLKGTSNANAFDLDDYFTGATNYSASATDHPNIQINVDAQNRVSFSQPPEWTGTETVVFYAPSAQGEQQSFPVYLTVEEAQYQSITMAHPKLFLTPAYRDILRARALGSLSNAFTMLSNAYETDRPSLLEDLKTYIYKYGYLYHMTGDERYASNVLAAMHKILTVNTTADTGDTGIILEGVAVGFDWIYDRLSRAEKDYFVAAINTVQIRNQQEIEVLPDFHNYGTRTWIGSLTAGLATYGENTEAPALIDLSRKLVEYGVEMPKGMRWLKSSIELTGGACNWEGPTYSRRTVFNILRYAEALRTASGGAINPWETLIPDMENSGWFFIYMTRPDHRLAFNHDVNYAQVSNFEIRNLAMMANYFRNGHFKTYMDTYCYWNPDGSYGSNCVWLGRNEKDLVYYLLWYDPELAAQPLDNCAKSRRFGDTIVMRTGFGTDATMVKFTSGVHWGTHAQLDHGSFTIYKGAPLAIDSGYYDAWGSGNNHIWDYWKRTIAHNLLTIKDPNEVWPGPYSDENDGGQRLVFETYDPPKAGCKAAMSGYQMEERYEEWVMGVYSNYECAADYDYIMTDITKAYNSIYAGLGNNQPKKANLVQREFVYLRPEGAAEYVVVFDRAEAVQASFPKRWLLHSGSWWDKSGKPELNGDEVIVRGNADAGIAESTNTDLTTITMSGGRLFCKTLLPEEPVVRKVGGAGYEFWVNNGNVSLYRDPSTTDDDPGAWRIEVRPAEARAFDNFLHVLYPTTNTADAMPDTELIRSSDMCGALIRDAGEPKILMFAVSNVVLRSASYTAAPSETVATRHMLCNMEAGPYDIFQDGVRVMADRATSAECVLCYTLRGGTHFRVVRSGASDDEPPRAPAHLKVW